MKYYLTIALLFSTSSWAREIKVSSIKAVSGFDSKFTLKTSYQDRVVLDCQSFIQGLFLGTAGLEQTIMMAEWECEELKDGIKGHMGPFKKYCIEVDLDRNVMDSHRPCP